MLMMEPADGTLGGLKVNIRGQFFQPCYKGSIVFDIGVIECEVGTPPHTGPSWAGLRCWQGRRK